MTRRYRLTLDVELPEATPEEARRGLLAAVHVAQGMAATAVRVPPASLLAVAEALTAAELVDGTPVLAPLDVVDPVDVVERRAIVRALATTRGHVRRAAALLRISHVSLYQRVRQHGVDVTAWRVGGRPKRGGV